LSLLLRNNLCWPGTLVQWKVKNEFSISHLLRIVLSYVTSPSVKSWFHSATTICWFLSGIWRSKKFSWNICFFQTLLYCKCNEIQLIRWYWIMVIHNFLHVHIVSRKPKNFGKHFGLEAPLDTTAHQTAGCKSTISAFILLSSILI
jgi:hypothetical protein